MQVQCNKHISIDLNYKWIYNSEMSQCIKVYQFHYFLLAFKNDAHKKGE